MKLGFIMRIGDILIRILCFFATILQFALFPIGYIIFGKRNAMKWLEMTADRTFCEFPE